MYVFAFVRPLMRYHTPRHLPVREKLSKLSKPLSNSKIPSKRLFFFPQSGKTGHGESRFLSLFFGVLFGDLTITIIELYDPLSSYIKNENLTKV
jgi:hypothetical protein